MPYAALSDVKARAGRVRGLFGQNNAPNDTEITGFLTDMSALVDAKLATHDLTVPVTDATAVSALRGIVADGALVLALTGTLDSEAQERAVGRVLDRAQERWEAAMREIESGDHAVVLMLLEAAGGGPADASNFWTENPQYDLLENWRRHSRSPSIGSPFRKGMKL